MAGSPTKGKTRAQGGIDTLPSGALRVRVYAGIDPVSKQRHYFTKIIEHGPNAEREVEAVRARFDARRSRS